MNEKDLEELVVAYLTEKNIVLKLTRDLYSPYGLVCTDINNSISHLDAVLVMLKKEMVQE